MNITDLQSSMLMWVACGIPVVIVLLQSILFLVKAYKEGPKMGLTREQMNRAMRSSAITSIGPSIVVLSGMLSLLVTMGAPVAWMRLSLIGSVMFEAIAAGIGTGAIGVKLGVDAMTPDAFTIGLWVMILCSVGWVIFATIFADKMDILQNKITGGNSAKLIALSGAAVVGIFAAMTAQHLVKMNKHAFAAVLGAVIMFVLQTICRKKDLQWLREWALTFALLGSIIVTQLLPA